MTLYTLAAVLEAHSIPVPAALLVGGGLLVALVLSRVTSDGRRCPRRCTSGKIVRPDGTFRVCKSCDGDGWRTKPSRRQR